MIHKGQRLICLKNDSQTLNTPPNTHSVITDNSPSDKQTRGSWVVKYDTDLLLVCS